MSEVLFPRDADFEAEAAASDYFDSADQITLAARALERAGLVTRERDERGRPYFRVVQDITGDDLAFATAAEHRRMEEGH